MDKKKEMDALLMNGTRARIVVDSVQGPFAIHQRVCDGRPIGDGWSVSHLLSGMALWTVVSKEDAIKIATWLEEQKLVPLEADQVLVWRDNMTMRQRLDLIEKLTAVAPRHTSPWRAST